MNYKVCELCNKYTILSKCEQNPHFIQIASCLHAVPLLWNVASAREWDFTAQQLWWFCGMLQVRENEISLRNSSGGHEYLRTL